MIGYSSVRLQAIERIHLKMDATEAIIQCHPTLKGANGDLQTTRSARLQQPSGS